MKTQITLFLILITISCLGQKMTLQQDLNKYFFDLPIENEIENIIEFAKKSNRIQTGTNIYWDSNRPYFTGNGKYIDSKMIAHSSQIEIFRSSFYTLWGHELDSLDIISNRIEYGDKLESGLRKEYKSVVKAFKQHSNRHEKYKLYADSGLIGYGFCFFRNEKDNLPYIAVEIGLGDCVSRTKTLIIKYYKTKDLKINN